MLENEYILKISIVGSPTNLTNQLVRAVADDTTEESLLFTFGFDFWTKRIQVETSLVRLILMNTIGKDQDPEGPRRRRYYENSSAAVITFDKGSRNSFNHVVDYYNEVKGLKEEYKEKALRVWDGKGAKGNLRLWEGIPLALIGIITGVEEVRAAEGRIFAEEREMWYYELGLQEREKILQLFVDLAKRCLQRMRLFSKLEL
ncbi:MAG: hypothetical protein ACFFE8_17180 [Candidatus Heimdallarchaeota archaeon]